VEDSGDLLWAETKFQEAICGIEQAIATTRAAIPYAVCPTCQGKDVKGCTICNGRGFISEFRYKTCIPEEIKALRAVKKVSKVTAKDEEGA
jgi:DnaJ-class molecular chaperone